MTFLYGIFQTIIESEDARERMFIIKLLGRNTTYYQDFAICVSNYLVEFEKHHGFEFRIISPHAGIRKRLAHFERNISFTISTNVFIL